MSWSVGEIPELSGRRVLVTGATSGLGYETALALLRRDAEVIVAARNADKAAKVAAELAVAASRPRPRVVELDLADLGSVARAAEQVTEPLDVLINNAGVMATPYRQTADGFELQVGTNHLGHFALTARLLPTLLESPSPRVVTVSSFLHRMARGIGRSDLRAENGYRKWEAYAKSKLANLLFMLELDRRARAAGSKLLSLGAHPGYASTHLQTAGPELGGQRFAAKVWPVVNKLAAVPAAAGAAPSLYAATREGIRPGSFVGPSFFGIRGGPTEERPTRTAQDPELAQRLWNWSADATGTEPRF